MARGRPKRFRCRIVRGMKAACQKRGRKVRVVATLKPNSRTLIRLCRLKRGRRSGMGRRKPTAAYEICKKR